MRFKGKTAIVTGAAQGIGRATAMRLASEGAQVVLVDRAVGVCEQVRERIVSDGGEALVIGADLESKDGVDHMVARALEAYGEIDIAVHNVGGTIWTKPFWEYSDDEIQQEITRSLWPTLRCCRAIIPVMLRQKRGTIVNIGSVATRGIYRVPYSAAKGGVHAMTTCMAMELAEHGIRVNCVAPGGIDSTDRVIPRNPNAPTANEKEWRGDVFKQTLRDTPLGRLGAADEIAAAVAFLASDDATYVTGQTMYVAGGGIG
jgi:dihydroxycyclohexadiene carboxylate dehydrogenase